jgi:hypothetical protein
MFDDDMVESEAAALIDEYGMSNYEAYYKATDRVALSVRNEHWQYAKFWLNVRDYIESIEAERFER